MSWSTTGLDPRLVQAAERMGWASPTTVQTEWWAQSPRWHPFSILNALKGKDVAVCAPTGSGKTGAYLLPLLHRLMSLTAKPDETGPRALVIVPTAELVPQVEAVIANLLRHGSAGVGRVVGLTPGGDAAAQRAALGQNPAIIISTPGRLKSHLSAKAVTLRTSLEFLVVDEADLIVSYGYEADMQRVAAHLPSICQTMLLSATLEEPKVASLVLTEPVSIKVDRSIAVENSGALRQLAFRCANETDKYVMLYSLVRTKMLRGKTLVFRQTIDGCYRLRLFLEQFGIRCAVLNADLPQNSRRHILMEFARGAFDILTATDGAEPNAEPAPAKKARKEEDHEFSAARGVDFKVQTVINFDTAPTAEAYIHRVGRTARAGSAGVALSLVASDQEQESLVAAVVARAGHDGVIDESLRALQGEVAEQPNSDALQPLQGLEIAMVESWRYRTEDALRSVTRHAVKAARGHDLRREFLNSEKLKAHFQEHPQDAAILRHGDAIQPHKVKKHLKRTPDYMKATPVIVPVLRSQKGKRRRRKQEEEPREVVATMPLSRRRRLEQQQVVEKRRAARATKAVDPIKELGMR